MSTAEFAFQGRLNFFLPKALQRQTITIHFRSRQSVKHLTESLGIPHPEVGGVHINGREGALAEITQDGDQVVVYPIEDGCPVEPRFLLDGHLGRLAAHLRMLGFDCRYHNSLDDPRLVEIACIEERILLTRDRRLLMRKALQYGYCLRSLNSLEQAVEVIRRFKLADRIQPFHRCLKCNHPLEEVAKEVILQQLEPLTKEYFDEFHRCPSCGQIYWKGSHYERMLGVIERIKA